MPTQELQGERKGYRKLNASSRAADKVHFIQVHLLFVSVLSLISELHVHVHVFFHE